MANTFELIQSYTLASASPSFDFTSISSSFTDLCLKYSLRSDNGDDYFALTLNGSSSSFSSRDIQGAGSGTPSSATRADNLLVYTQDPSSMTANTFSSGEIYFPNYAGSTNKSFSQDTAYENNATGAGMALRAGLWSNTAAINRVTITKASGNFTQYSTAYLYGVKNA